VRYSRQCRTFIGVESGPDVQRRWLRELLALEPGIVLPCTDGALELIARHRADLVGRGHLVYDCDDELTLAMLDKERMYALAREVGSTCREQPPFATRPGWSAPRARSTSLAR
jgi:hypothetical protein